MNFLCMNMQMFSIFSMEYDPVFNYKCSVWSMCSENVQYGVELELKNASVFS